VKGTSVMNIENLRDRVTPAVCPPLMMTSGKGMGVLSLGFIHDPTRSIQSRYRISRLYDGDFSPPPQGVERGPRGMSSIWNSCEPSPPYDRSYTKAIPMRPLKETAGHICTPNNTLRLHKGLSHRRSAGDTSVHRNRFEVHTCSRTRSEIDEPIRDIVSRPASGNPVYYKATDLHSSRSSSYRSKGTEQ
jgi:hypothetical protein